MTQMSEANFDSEALNLLLEPDNRETRDQWRTLVQSPLFKPVHNISLDYSRELAYARLKKISENKLMSIFDFEKNPKRVFAGHEMCGFADGSLATKMTVQWNLFGGTAFAFHTEDHKEVLDNIDSMKYVGCFCLTELGFGNNAVKMETTATWDQKTQEFIINCPTIRSQKYWATNGACHAHFGVVFAQTQINGKNEGINIFLVRIRDDNLKEMPGVYIEDMGMKQGCNGVDNAKIIFKNVRIPKKGLLNKICDITPDGVFTHQVKKPRQRFLEVADRLLSGRICIACMCNSGAKGCLTVAIKYSKQRLAVGPSGESDKPIWDYQLQQNAIMPLLAKTICLQFGLNLAKDYYQNYYCNQIGDHMELVRMCCIIKAFVSWNVAEVGAITRERCGGQGYLLVNRVGEALGLAHAGQTAEGDNRVLTQKVAKELLADVSKGNYELPKMDVEEENLNKIQKLDDLNALRNLVVFKLNMLTENLVQVMSQRILVDKKGLFEVWMQEESDLIQRVAHAYGDYQVFNCCFEIAKRGDFGQFNSKVMERLVVLYGLGIVENNLGWYISNEGISAQMGKRFGDVKSGVIKEINPYVDGILESFKIGDTHAPIAGDYLEYNSKPNNGELGPKPKL